MTAEVGEVQSLVLGRPAIVENPLLGSWPLLCWRQVMVVVTRMALGGAPPPH